MHLPQVASIEKTKAAPITVTFNNIYVLVASMRLQITSAKNNIIAYLLFEETRTVIRNDTG
jgi:hypothetical protein